ncbi:uncharacterized protein DFL_004575 [Arthrobotrys flagrans]|uniref:Uncharacterized protein n=1 Tax=Arthrobotrys flagrans TaxID=97331 RepID=A0A437A4Z0_ARTFL|nr:hypothetical protein DFL_004575 [Arthrobotrys flagrans]
MTLLHEWIEPDLEAELQRLEEISQQFRKQRNSAQTNRSREILKYSKLKAAAKAEYQTQLRADPKSKPILESIPKSEHCKLPYDNTLVAPIDWTPPRHIRSPLRETKHYVQIVQTTSEVVPGQPFNAIVTDGHVSIPALFKLCNGWTTSLPLVKTGAVFSIRRYFFRFPGSCSKSWGEGLTRNDQLSLARSNKRRPKRPKTLKYPSIAASIGSYRWENNFLPADGLLLEIDISKLIPTKAPCPETPPPSIEDNWKLMDIVDQFPVLPIRIPGLDLWRTEIIEEVARMWYGEIAWYRFSQSISPSEFWKLPSIKATFLQRLQIDDKIKIAVRRARTSVFESMYRAEGPIGRLYEIRQAYRDLQSLLKDKSQAPILRIPGTNRPLQNQNYSPTQEGPRTDFQSQGAMTSTPQFATQFPPARLPSGARHRKEARNNMDLEKRIARFRYDLDPVECENFSEIIRTLYARAREGDFETEGDVSLIYRHISDFYATKILTKVEITRVKPQASVARSSRPAEVKRKESIQKSKRPAERPRTEASCKEATAIIPPPRVLDLSGREKLQAALTKIKKQEAIEAARKASGSPVATPGIQSYSHGSVVAPTSHREIPEDKSYSKLTKKTSSKSLRSQGNVETPVARASTPVPLAGEPMEGITMHTGSQHQEPSNGLPSKMGRLNTRRSMPTSLKEHRARFGVKSTQDVSSTKHKAHDRLPHPEPVVDHSPQISTPPLASTSPIVLTSPSPRKRALKLPLKSTGEALTRKASLQSAPKPSTPDTGRSAPAPIEKKKPPAVVKADIGSTVTSHPETQGPSRPDTEMAEPPQPEDFLTRLNKMLQLIQNEKDQDKVLPERTRVPEDQAKVLSKHTALWPPPKKELQRHLRAIPNLEPKDNGARTCRFPEDFEPYNSTIETATQPGTQSSQKWEKEADSGTDNQSENPAPSEQHVFTLTNQPAEEDDSDDVPVEGWEATPRSQLIDPFETSDADSILNGNPPPASAMQTPEVSEHERTPKKVKSAVVKANTPVNPLRRAVAEKYTPPVKRAVGVPMRTSSPVEDDFVAYKYEKPSTMTTATTTTIQGTRDSDDEMVMEGPQIGEEEGGEEEDEEADEEADEEEGEDAEDDEEEYDDEEEEEEEEEESEVQVLQTQSSPHPRHQTPRFRDPQPDQVVQVTPRVTPSSQLEHPGAPRSSPNVSKRKADQISISPVKAGSAVSPMIRGPKVLKIERAEEIGETFMKRANAAIASSKEGVRQDLNISQADLAKGKAGNRGTFRARLYL